LNGQVNPNKHKHKCDYLFGEPDAHIGGVMS